MQRRTGRDLPSRGLVQSHAELVTLPSPWQELLALSTQPMSASATADITVFTLWLLVTMRGFLFELQAYRRYFADRDTTKKKKATMLIGGVALSKQPSPTFVQ